MHLIVQRVSIVCASTILLACAEISYRAPEPVLNVPFANADQAYLVGRGEHLARRYTEASAAYQAALASDPAHINARNGLATLHAEQGQFADAIVIWQSLTESAPSGPESAFLFGNLGYAHYLSGDNNAALQALEKACVLDPLNHFAWYHLGQVLDKLGQPERAQNMFKQAEALKNHDFKSDYAVAPRAGVSAIDSAIEAKPQQGPQWDNVQVSQNASGVYELRRVGLADTDVPRVVPLPAASASAAMPAPVQTHPVVAPVTTTTTTMLEISNGNGVNGMARELAKLVGNGTLRVVRLTNQKGFAVANTRIEYEPSYRSAAESLASRLNTSSLIAVKDIGRADMRLVIGRDLLDVKTALVAKGKKGPPEKG
jgi:tetratricopeptide (TPR) repeat protein